MGLISGGRHGRIGAENRGRGETGVEIDKTLELLVTAVSAMSKNMDLRFDRLEDRMDRLESRMDGLESRMDGLESRMDRMESDIAVLKTDVAGLKTDVAGLRTDVDGLKTDVARLDARTERVETDVAKLRIANEQHIVPALKVIGENWSDMYKSVQATREKVEQLAETQDVHGMILRSKVIKSVK